MATTTKTKTKRASSNAERPTAEVALVAEIIKIIETSADSLPPWRRPWNAAAGPHRNLLTSHAYKGANPALLEIVSSFRGLTTPLWLGFAQAKEQGWFPAKGSSSVRIVRPARHVREEEAANGEKEQRIWYSFRPIPVFNALDLRGQDEASQQALDAAVAAAMGAPEERSEHERLALAEDVLEAWPVPTVFGGDRACYQPAADRISMPVRASFESAAAYCATWAHEQIHSTGHKDRLNRPMDGLSSNRGSYAREELVAELGSLIVGQRLQIGCELTQHAAYCGAWLAVLAEGPSALFKALAEARMAADMICGKEEMEQADA